MDQIYRRQLERNIVKYAWFKIFTKRVFLPLIAIHLVNVGGVTVGQLAFIAGAVAISQLLLQIPTGYVADKWGNRRAILAGTAISSISPLFYIFMPNFTGGLLAALIFFGGYAFQSGAIEAFMHDTLVALGKDRQYARIMGRAQSYGLIGNTVLLALVPATYAIDQNLPFIIGSISLLGMTVLAASFTFPPDRHEGVRRNPLTATRKVVTIHNVALFLFAGLMIGISHRGIDFRELVFQDVGIAVGLFGALAAVSSLLGALIGRYLHLLDDMPPLAFYLTDLLFHAGCLALIGLSRNPWLVITGFTLLAGYGRVQYIVYQAKLLHSVSHAYKATLISALNLFTVFGEVAAAAALAGLIGFSGYIGGYLLFAGATIAVGLFFWVILLAERRSLIRKMPS